MARDKYIRLSDIQKYPIRINHYDKKNGNIHFILGIESVIEYAEYLPGIDTTTDCDYCRYATKTKKLFRITNPNGTEVSTEFNFCPKCGKPLSTGVIDHASE